MNGSDATGEALIGFERQLIDLPLDEILPSRMLKPAIKESSKYERIAASVRQVGLVEPLVVCKSRGSASYLLLDGHVRMSILRDMKQSHARCIVAKDDEAFTYNRRVNRLATIQEHYMIVRALDRGVSEEKLASALNVDVGAIRQRRFLLNGIAPEAADALKDKPVGVQAFQKLRKMKPLRQIEVAELMIAANNYSTIYVKALLATTKPADLHRPDRLSKAVGLSADQMARLEREMDAVHHDYKAIEASYGDDMLVLVIAAGYLERLISRGEVERFLKSRHPEILAHFRSIVSATLRIPRDGGHGFHGKVGADSTRRWARIPREDGQCLIA